MTKKRQFIQCDVFSPFPARGNALAVVVDGDGLSDAQMQEFATWTNLAETTFLLSTTDPVADYRVRIFTTSREMLFAGHPTLGSCAAWLHSGGHPREAGMVRQECGIGIVEVDITGEVPAFIAPPTSIELLPEANIRAISHLLKLNPDSIMRTARLDNGPVWQAFALRTAADVLAVDSATVRWPDVQPIGLIGPHPAGSECSYEVRMLAPSSGMSEDPITGSLNSALAHWLHSLHELDGEIVNAQGTNIQRHGRVHIKPDPQVDARILIGGQTHILVEGTVEL